MIHLEFKNKLSLKENKTSYSRVLALIIRESSSLKKAIKLETEEINLEQKIIFK